MYDTLLYISYRYKNERMNEMIQGNERCGKIKQCFVGVQTRTTMYVKLYIYMYTNTIHFIRVYHTCLHLHISFI